MSQTELPNRDSGQAPELGDPSVASQRDTGPLAPEETRELHKPCSGPRRRPGPNQTGLRCAGLKTLQQETRGHQGASPPRSRGILGSPSIPSLDDWSRTGSRKRAQISARGQLLAAECSPETSGLVASSARPAAGSPPWPRLAPSVLAPVSCPGPGPFLGSPAPGGRAGCSEPRRNCISWAHPDPGVPSYWASLLLRPPWGAERRPPGQARGRSASGAETQVPCPVARGAHHSGFQTRPSLWVAGPSHDRCPSAAPSRDG